MLPDLDAVVETGVGSFLTSASEPAERWRDVQAALVHWSRCPDDEDVDPPTEEALQAASRFVNRRAGTADPPSRFHLDAGGAIVFEWRDGERADRVIFWEDGEGEHARIASGQVLNRVFF